MVVVLIDWLKLKDLISRDVLISVWGVGMDVV